MMEVPKHTASCALKCQWRLGMRGVICEVLRKKFQMGTQGMFSSAASLASFSTVNESILHGHCASFNICTAAQVLYL